MNHSHRSIEEQIQNYIDEVAAVLRADGNSADDIESICDGLKTQIFDMANQTASVTKESVSQAIESMEQPTCFSMATEQKRNTDSDSQTTQQPKEALHILASVGFYLAIMGPALAVVTGVLAAIFGSDGWEFGSFILFVAAMAALVFGVISRTESRGRIAIIVSLGTLISYCILFLVGIILE